MEKSLPKNASFQEKIEMPHSNLHQTTYLLKLLLFSDETKFNLISSDGIRWVRLNIQLLKFLTLSTPKKELGKGDGGIMVWGSFSRFVSIFTHPYQLNAAVR